MVNYTYDILPGRICPWLLTVRKSIFTARQLAAEKNRKVWSTDHSGHRRWRKSGRGSILASQEGLRVPRFHPKSLPIPLDYAAEAELPNATTDYLE